MTNIKNNKCECQKTGVLKEGMSSWYDETNELPFVVHKPNECECLNELTEYHKDGKKVWLCSNCVMGEEKVI